MFVLDVRHACASANASRRAGRLPRRYILTPGHPHTSVRHTRTHATTLPLWNLPESTQNRVEQSGRFSPLSPPSTLYGSFTRGPRKSLQPLAAPRTVWGRTHSPASPAAFACFILLLFLSHLAFFMFSGPPPYAYAYLVQFYIYLLCLYDTQVPISRYGVVRRSRLPGPKMASGGWCASAQRDQHGAGSARVRGTERGRPGNAIMTGLNIFRFLAILGLI